MAKARRLLIMIALAGMLGATVEHSAAKKEEPRACNENEWPAVDVAGHLAIAARRDLHPLRDGWRWGAVPVGIAIGNDGSVYWAQYRTDTIERVNREGKGAETIARVDGPLGLTIDPAGGMLFYVTDRHYLRSIARLRPGGKPESLICGINVNRPFAIALAAESAKLYWTESINGRIRSAAIDGARLGTIFDDGIANIDERPDVVALSSAGVAVDERRGFVFWSDLRTATIVRARLDGSERKTILSRDQGIDFPTALALDAPAGKLYWADPGSETIGRAGLDGSHPEIVARAADGVLEPYGLAIDAERRLLYWTDIARNALYRTTLDHKKIERFLDLDALTAPRAAKAADTCEGASAHARQEFLRRWLKLVRTCVVGVSATQAIIRAPSDLTLPAKSCGRQLGPAHDVAALRALLEGRCDARQVAAAIEDTLQLGAEIVAADLPRAGPYLRKIRPFVAREGSGSTEAALATIDDLVARLERLARTPASAVVWTLPASGQVTSYAAATRLAGGQGPVADDGAVRAGAPHAFIDNGDGTMTDRNTGLTWEKKCNGCGGPHDANARYSWRSKNGSVDVTGWLAALNSDGGKGFTGHDDWRLPQIGELLSIVDYERFNPAVSDALDRSECGLGCGLNDSKECSCTRLGAYWTDGSSPHAADIVPVVLFNLGLVVGQSTDEDAFVRAVRGPRAEQSERFVDNGDGTITDRRTRLMWEKKCRCRENLHDVDRRLYWSFDGTQETVWDWLSALNHEGGRGFAGHQDWRIPNVKELYSLFDGSRSDPSIDPVFTKEGCTDLSSTRCSVTHEGLHWTSTTFADFPSLAVAVGFSTPGELEHDPPPGIIRVVGGVEPHEKTLRRAVRAVRGPVKAALR